MVITQSGPPQCASTCGDLVQQPSCGVARYYIDTCASSCSTTEKENFLKRASNQPCTFASASTPPPSSDPSPSPGGGSGEFGSGDVGSGEFGSGGGGGRYCDYTSPSQEACCALTTYQEQDSCLIGKGIDPGLTPSPSPMPSSSCKCFANGASNEAFCESETNPITDPIVCESDSRCHWGPAQDSNCRAMVITQSGPPQCASTCDLVQQPSCGVARYYIDTCASSCSTTEKENFLKRASNQPCTFASGSTPPPSSDPSPSPGGGSGEFGSGDVGSGGVVVATATTPRRPKRLAAH